MNYIHIRPTGSIDNQTVYVWIHTRSRRQKQWMLNRLHDDRIQFLDQLP